VATNARVAEAPVNSNYLLVTAMEIIVCLINTIGQLFGCTGCMLLKTEVGTLCHTKYDHMVIDGAIFGATIQK
jgi:hypothetical protein